LVGRAARPSGAVGQVGDHLDELGAPVAVLTCELDQPAGLGEDRAILANGEFAGWLVWLPRTGRLLAGPAADIGRYAGYAIDARTAAAKPFTFFPGSSYLANAPSDITYGAVLVSRAAAAPAP
jgi:hypothetical protein